jgi:glycosyltransferase involved in cell wall biosynthesis
LITNRASTYSAILCAHNSQATIRDALLSIVGQSLESNEIIVVDDYSTDNTYSILEQFALEHSEITIIRNRSNLGQAESRNIAASSATGDILIFFDDDDVSFRERAKAHLEMHALPSDLSFVSSQKIYENGYIVDCSNQHLTGVRLEPSVWVEKLTLGLEPRMLNDLWIPACTSSITNKAFQALGGYDKSFRRLEDADLFLRAAAANLTSSWSSTILVKRRATFSEFKGGVLETSHEKLLLSKHRKFLATTNYLSGLRLIQIREAYFTKKYFRMIILICKNPFVGVVSWKRIGRFFARLIHDLKKR